MKIFRTKSAIFIERIYQPPSGGCELKRTKYGFPKEIAFDHDLGDDDTVINFLNFLSNYFIDNNIRIPKDFKYSIHSQNPVGKENIDSKMKQLLKYFS